MLTCKLLITTASCSIVFVMSTITSVLGCLIYYLVQIIMIFIVAENMKKVCYWSMNNCLNIYLLFIKNMELKLYWILILLIFDATYQVIYPKNKNINSTAKTDESQSIIINSLKDLHSYLQTYDDVIVLFHISWCGHCKHFLPIFDEASMYLVTHKFKFLKINCEHKSICTSFGINHFPTVQVYNKGNLLSYEPPRELIPLLEFIDKLSSNPIIQINSNYTKELFYNEYGTFSPYILYNESRTEFITCINKLAKTDFKSTFYFGIETLPTNNNKLNDEKIIFDNDGLNVVYIWKDNDCSSIKEFLQANQFPLVSEFNFDAFDKLSVLSKMSVILFYNKSNDKHISFINNELKLISYKHRNIYFGYVDINEDKSLSSYFNVKYNSNMQVIVYDFKTFEYYYHNKEIEPNTIEDLVSNINKLEFITGNIIKDFLKIIGLGFLNPYLHFVILVCIIIAMIISIAIIIITENKEPKQKTQ